MTRFGVVSCMDSVQWPHGHCEWEGGDGVLSGVHIYYYLHCNCSSVDLSLSESPSAALHFFAHPPLPVYIYSYVFTPGLYRIDIGVCLRCGNGPEYTFRVTVRPTQGDEIGQPCWQLPPCAWHVICMVRIWRRSTNTRSQGHAQVRFWTWNHERCIDPEPKNQFFRCPCRRNPDCTARGGYRAAETPAASHPWGRPWRDERGDKLRLLDPSKWLANERTRRDVWKSHRYRLLMRTFCNRR